MCLCHGFSTYFGLPECATLLFQSRSTAIIGVHLQIKDFPIKDFVFVIIF